MSGFFFFFFIYINVEYWGCIIFLRLLEKTVYPLVFMFFKNKIS